MKRLVIRVLLAALALLGAACGSSSDVAVFSEGDSEIAVSAGERFRIEFTASPGVGDDWTVVGEPDVAVARFIDEGFESDAAEDVVGAPGTEYFLFEATAPGTTEIELEYCYRGCGGEDAQLDHRESFEVVVS
jgi:predicted secreted protein